jgi:hypothetical protein
MGRARAVRTLLLLVFPWLLPVSWIVGTMVIVLAAIGVPLPASVAPTADVVRGPILILVVVMPILAFVVGAMLREITLEAVAELLDTKWRFAPERPGPTVRATTRAGRLRSAEGSMTLREGAPVGGVDVSSQDVLDAGVVDVAGSLGEDPRDVLVMAAFAGMMARGELEVRRTRRLRWRHGETASADDASGWEARLVLQIEPAGPVERALAAALQERGATSVFDVWGTAYAVADPTGEPRGAGEALVGRLRSWTLSEPAFHRVLVGLGESRRSD